MVLLALKAWMLLPFTLVVPAEFDPTAGADATEARRLLVSCCLNVFAVVIRALPSAPDAPWPWASDSVIAGANKCYKLA